MNANSFYVQTSIFGVIWHLQLGSGNLLCYFVIFNIAVNKLILLFICCLIMRIS